MKEITKTTLIITPQFKARIAKILEYSDKNRYSIKQLQDMCGGKLNTILQGETIPFDTNGEDVLSIGDNPNHRVLLPMCYGVIYNIEEQPLPMGWSRHISIQLAFEPDDLPEPEIVKEIIKEFGFITSLEDACTYVEGNSINIIEPLDSRKAVDYAFRGEDNSKASPGVMQEAIAAGIMMTEEGMQGAFTRNQASGAILNGSRIEKCESRPGDAHVDGELGTVLGSIDARGKMPFGVDVNYFYFIEWDSEKGKASGITDNRIKEIK